MDFGYRGSAEDLVGDLYFEDWGFHGLELFSSLIELSAVDGDFEVADFGLALLDSPKVSALAWCAAHFCYVLG